MAGKWRYVLPNAVTCASITIGLLSISESIRGGFDSAAWLILLCVLLDKLDGTLARLLRGTSEFGVELDSLSDMLTFGVAPPVLLLAKLRTAEMTSGGLASLPAYEHIAYLGCFLFAVAAALRLAKFNVNSSQYGTGFFFGCPTTVAGAFVAAYYLTARKYGLPIEVFQSLPLAMIVFAMLMVSRLPLPKVARRRTLVMNVFQLTNVFFVYLFGLLRLYPEYLLAIGNLYLIVGMLWASSKGIRPGMSAEQVAGELPRGPGSQR